MLGEYSFCVSAGTLIQDEVHFSFPDLLTGELIKHDNNTWKSYVFMHT
jgi:hypothetical protein